jgi:hypothetical protein
MRQRLKVSASARTGQKVLHAKFGRGVIETFYVYPDGTTTIWVNFSSHGPKTLMPRRYDLRIDVRQSVRAIAGEGKTDMENKESRDVCATVQWGNWTRLNCGRPY